MSYLRTASERAAYRRIFYQGTETYVNKLGIRDRQLLEDTERALTTRRAALGFPPQAHCRSYAGFKSLHRHLFQDLYAWSGQERRYRTGRGSIPFAVPKHVAAWMQQQFRQLAQKRHLVGLDKAAFSARAAVYVNEMNAAHPFVDGNGRTQEFWLRMLAENAGFDFALGAADAERWNSASRLGFVKSDHMPMAKLIRCRLRVSSRTARLSPERIHSCRSTVSTTPPLDQSPTGAPI